MPDTPTSSKQPPIQLSDFTKALIQSLQSIKSRSRPDEFSKISVSQAVSFFALAYEKIRNAVEYREDHLIRRAAIERIIKRRLAMNPEGKNEAENLIRELLWARYFDNESLGSDDVKIIQQIIDKYLSVRKILIVGRQFDAQQFLGQFLLDMMTCEIEEVLSQDVVARYNANIYFIYQVLRNKIRIEGLQESQRDAFLLTALEKTYRRSDKPYQRYHLFTTFYKPFFQYSQEELDQLSSKLPAVFKKIDEMLNNPYVEKLAKFTRKQLPPFLILFSVVSKKFKELPSILTIKERLWNEVDIVCREKYQKLRSRLNMLAVRSFIYIFLTKMIFALILEYPVSKYFYGEVNNTSIAINSFFPPILMLIIISFFRIPGEENTKKIFHRIVSIIDVDKNFETQIAFMPKKASTKRPILIFGFTIFYSLTFFITLSLIYEGLTRINFNLVSQIIFVFFISLVTFFSYRIKQSLNEYKLEDKESIFAPIIDFFFMPILSLGKFFSGELARLNFFIFIFDFLIEAPFKFVFEIVEEWISFVRKRKEEII